MKDEKYYTCATTGIGHAYLKKLDLMLYLKHKNNLSIEKSRHPGIAVDKFDACRRVFNNI